MNTLFKLKLDLKEKIKEVWITKNKNKDNWLIKYFNIEEKSIRKSYFDDKKYFRTAPSIEDFLNNKKEIENLIFEANIIRNNIHYLESAGYTEQTKESNKSIGERI